MIWTPPPFSLQPSRDPPTPFFLQPPPLLGQRGGWIEGWCGGREGKRATRSGWLLVRWWGKLWFYLKEEKKKQGCRALRSRTPIQEPNTQRPQILYLISSEVETLEHRLKSWRDTPTTPSTGELSFAVPRVWFWQCWQWQTHKGVLFQLSSKLMQTSEKWRGWYLPQMATNSMDLGTGWRRAKWAFSKQVRDRRTKK